MGWQQITALPMDERLEKPVQAIFNSWGKNPLRIAGAPRWLRECRAENATRAFAAYGYSFTPDVLWDCCDKRYVLELKCAPRYEPLALAEVLHHAQALEDLGYAMKPAVPVVVTMYSPWVRAAVARSRAGGAMIHALEMDLLDDRSLIWFDDPHAAWKVSDPPAVVPGSHRVGWRWHRVEEAQTWIAVRGVSERRPVIFTEPYVMVAQVFDQNGTALDEYVLWQGTPPSARTSSSMTLWADAAFFHWTLNSGKPEIPILAG
jgi:hypothetical protein